ncbi:beta strand repeat-containing protein [Calothrix sp. 336/3]|uniref:beta strand repeat-containing protein n=1 Tax=Calothrix sp. 336/3 TaxID=1337936 RepID=UPI00069B7C57|nr:DUF11 domain-containing protein [Calothrix sp. 336/3]
MKSIFKEIKALHLLQPKIIRYTSLGLACGWVLLFAGDAWAKVSINKQFSPTNINPNQISKLTIELFNNKPTQVTNTTFTDNLPTGVVVADIPNIVNGCDGTLTATPGGTSIVLTGGIIPASTTVAGKCTITIDVTSKVSSTNTQTYVNIIPVNGLTGSQDGNTEKNADEANATLVVEPIRSVTGSKSFSTAVLHGNGTPTTMTITLNNPNLFDLTEAELTDNLPSGTKVAATPAISNSCGGTVTATAGSTIVALANGTITAKSSCTIQVNLEATDATNVRNTDVTNTIPANNLKTKEGITNTSPLTATIKVQTAAEIAKSFNPGTIQGGETSELTITIRNYNSAAITNADLIDVMPTDVKPLSITSNGCGGTATVTATQVRLTGGTIPAAPVGVGSGSCKIKAQVTSTKLGTYTNNITAGDFNGIKYNSASANLNVLAPVGVSKSFAPSQIIRGEETELTITLTNSDSNPATITSFQDNLTTMGTGYTVVAGSESTTCGGTVNASGTLIEMNSGTIPAATGTAPNITKGSCIIKVKIKADDLTGQGGNAYDGQVVNTVPAANLKTSLGNNPFEAKATLSLNGKVQVQKSFSDATRTQGQETTLTIKLLNTQSSSVSITSFKDDLLTMGTNFNNSNPAFTIASGSSSTTCGGTLNNTSGTTLIQMTGGTIPAGTTTNPGFCTITVPVKVSLTAPKGSHTNTINEGELKTNIGDNAIKTKASIDIKSAATVSKSFSLPAVAVGGKTRLTIKLDRDADAPALTGVNLSDNLPSGHTVDSTPNVVNNCGGTVNASGSTISLTNGSLSGASCTISVDIRVPNTAGTRTNTIPAQNLTTTQGVTNEFAATADIKATAAKLNLNKDFSPQGINPNGTSRLNIDIKNNEPDAIALTGVSLTDNLPLGMELTSNPNPTLTGTGCSGGTFTAVPGGNQFILTGANIQAGTVCVMSVNVTSKFAGNLTNQLPATISANSAEQVTNGNLVKKTLTVLGIADVIVSKTDNKKFVAPGQTTQYTITVENAKPATGSQWDNVAGVELTDNAPTGLTFIDWVCSATSGSACAVESGTGNVFTSLTLLAGGKATIVVNAKVNDNVSKGTEIKNVATVDLPATVTDPEFTTNKSEDINTVGGNPNVLLVKRITAVNGITNNGGTNLAGYINEPSNPYDDNTIEPSLAPKPPQYPSPDTDKWLNPSSFLIGGTNGGNVKPGDEIEYTIYFISTGDSEANKVRFCDRVPNNTTFIPTAKSGDPNAAPGGISGSDRGIITLYNGTLQSLTNVQDGDIGQYFPPGVEPSTVYPGIQCGGANTNGAVVVDLGTLPNATSSGNPAGSYGFVRFRGKVK